MARKPDATSFKGQGSLSAISRAKGGTTLGATPPNQARLDAMMRASPDGLTFGAVADYGGPGGLTPTTGTSIFDPVLCELAYRWWAPPGGLVLDPFAGGSVRGIVAGMLGRKYLGIDLRGEQVVANCVQADAIFAGHPDLPKPRWITGDSAEVIARGDAVTLGPCDFVFSCPPYADLEVYSEDPRDLSTMEYAAFHEAYREIIRLACGQLRQDRFACFVVGDVRGPDGCYRNFVSHTIEAFIDAGLALYNEAILLTAVGSLPVRTGRQFAAGRKLGKTHQNVLVFVKGDGKAAADAVGPVEFGDVPEAQPLE